MIPQQVEDALVYIQTHLPDAITSASPITVATTVVIGIPVFQIVKYLVKFSFGYLYYRNQAMGVDLPRVSVPYLDTNMFFSNFVRTETYKKIVYRLPAPLIKWARWVRPEFRWHAKYGLHAEKGDLFIVVTPEQVYVNVADADVIMDVFTRRGDFPKYQPVLDGVRLFGENVLTTEGHTWSRHRKIVAPPFSEGVNQLVWKEAIRQATAMLQYWKTTPSADHVHLSTSTKLLALNVLSYTEFGIPLPFNHSMDLTAEEAGTNEMDKDAKVTEPGLSGSHTMSFRTAVTMLANDFRKVLVVLKLPKWLYSRFGQQFVELGVAKREVDQYIQEIINREQVSPSLNEAGKETLVSALVRNEALERGMDKSGGLSSKEMLGNTYLFILAGLDTTSSSLQFTLINLALHQDKQAWMLRQLDEDLHSAGMGSDPATWDYQQLFPKLTGVACAMYESLRTHPVIPTLLRTTADKTQTITANGKTYIMPPGFCIALNFIGVHYNPKYWGPNADKFDPERWAMNSPANKNDPTIQPSARFPGTRKPPRGAFIPWSEGFRACLGRRFAEVEMAAVLATLFSHHRCEIRRLEGESVADAAARAQRSLDHATMQVSLAVREKVELVWYPRK